MATKGYTRIQVPYEIQQKIKGYAREWKIATHIVTTIIYRHNVNVYEKAKIYKLLKQYNYIKR